MNIKLAVFDFDGTLMDTREAIIVAKQETMKQLGIEVKDETTCASTIGLSAKLGFQTIYPDFSEEMIDQCVKLYRENFEITKETVPPVLFPDIIETLEKLNDLGITCTIATSRNGKSLREFLDKKGITKYFSYILASEDTKLLKPNAEPVLKTLDDLKISADEAIVIGDMPVDILMGKNAGAHTCGVTYGNSDEVHLKEAGAEFVINKIQDLLSIISNS